MRGFSFFFIHSSVSTYYLLEVSNLKLALVTILFLVAVAWVHLMTDDSYAYPPPQNKEDCMQLFQDILKIQDQRSEASDLMSFDTKKFKAGEMTKEVYHGKRMGWLAVEGRLRHQVTHLYDIGYAGGCFNS